MDGNAGNAWDLVGDDEKSRSYETDEDSEESSEEEENLQIEAPRQRSKSPAVESLRKVSRIVLNKIGFGRKKEPKASPLRRQNELPHWNLTDFCELPKEFCYGIKPKRIEGPKILSSDTLKDTRRKPNLKEKWFVRKKPTENLSSYLFRSQDSETEHLAEAMTGSQMPERLHVYDPFCPVHGSKRKLFRRRQQLLDMHSFVNSMETDNDQFSPILASDAYFAKAIRKHQRAMASGALSGHVAKSKRKIQANLLIISFAFLFLFTGFHGLQYLQTSVNGQMGADALGTFYTSLAISSLIVPSFVVNRLGSKLTLITAFGVHIIYMLANFLPRYYSLVPASVLAGIAASCMWQANSVYITQSGVNYAKLNIESQNVVIVRFFGLFFMIVHLGQVIGSLLSSVILSQSVQMTASLDEADSTCGNGFPRNLSTLSERAQRNLQRPGDLAYSVVVAVDLCFVIVALLIVLLFLNALRRDVVASKKSQKYTAEVLILTLKNLQKPKVLLLIPLTIFNGIEQAFAVGIYTKAYVACGLGIAQIGYVMTTFGVADAVCSLVFGPLIKMFGRMPLFCFGAVMNVLMIMTLMVWPLNPGDRVLFNVIAGVWGMADGVWNTQVQGFWVGLTGKTSLEVAFANYRFWMSSGLATGFFLMQFTTVNSYLVFSFILLLIGVLGYFVTELIDPVMTQIRKGEKESKANSKSKEIPKEVQLNTESVQNEKDRF